jgi:ESCRT-II complex subunit VPS22
VLQIGNKKLVRSVPKELDKDQAELLLLAQVNKAYESLPLL